MDILFKGRHTSLKERFRQHASAKLAKLEKLDHKVIRVDVEVSKERGRRERVELTVVSRGPAVRAEAAADDRYAALELALDKLDARLRRACDRRKHRHAGHAPVKAAATLDGPAGRPARSAAGPGPALGTGPAQADSAAPDAGPAEAEQATDGDMVPIEMEGDGPLVVRQKFHSASPMTMDQALFEMELVGHDFYLFRDKELGCPSVVYRRCGYRYGVIRLVEEEKVPRQPEQLVAS